jgi:hypothetical protein
LRDPARGLAVVIFCNVQNAPNLKELAIEVADSVQQTSTNSAASTTDETRRPICRSDAHDRHFAAASLVPKSTREFLPTDRYAHLWSEIPSGAYSVQIGTSVE